MYDFIDFPSISDERGSLIPVEFSKKIPFTCRRIYFLKNLRTDLRRGFHAHKTLKQVFYCVQGSCEVLMDNSLEKYTYTVSGRRALVIPEMVWHEMYNFSKDCVVAVFASEIYDENDYIRDYQNFIHLTGGLKP